MEKNNFYYTFKKIIRECNVTNTYKMAWAKAIVEIACESTPTQEVTTIYLKDIAEKMMKYYWNQTIFFNLVQGSNLQETPLIVQHVKELIKKYYDSRETKKPERFERIEEYLKSNMEKEYAQCLIQVTKTLKADVSWRFTVIRGENNNGIYQ